MKRFIRGLKSSMYMVMVSQVFPSYSSAVDSARLIEAREIEDMTAGQSKRPRDECQSFRQQGLSAGPSRGRSGRQAHGFRGGLDRDRQLVAQAVRVAVVVPRV